MGALYALEVESERSLWYSLRIYVPVLPLPRAIGIDVNPFRAGLFVWSSISFGFPPFPENRSIVQSCCISLVASIALTPSPSD